jgi:dTMP kinase
MTEPKSEGRGRFITLEGGEGAGKSTQIKSLADYLRSLGHEVIVTREPGGSPVAEQLREVILSGAAASLGSAAEAVLFSAARIDHIAQTIAPALARGAYVISDRFADSTRAYQGTQGKVDPTLIDALEKVAVGRFRPDLTLILDLPAETGLARATRRRADAKADRFEAEDVSFHQGLRKAFLDIAAREPQRCAVIDAAQSPEDVAKAIRDVVAARLHLRGAA